MVPKCHSSFPRSGFAARKRGKGERERERVRWRRICETSLRKYAQLNFSTPSPSSLFPPRALGSLLCHATLVRSVPLYLPPPAGSIIPVHTVDGAPWRGRFTPGSSRLVNTRRGRWWRIFQALDSFFPSFLPFFPFLPLSRIASLLPTTLRFSLIAKTLNNGASRELEEFEGKKGEKRWSVWSFV